MGQMLLSGIRVCFYSRGIAASSRFGCISRRFPAGLVLLCLSILAATPYDFRLMKRLDRFLETVVPSEDKTVRHADRLSINNE